MNRKMHSIALILVVMPALLWGAGCKKEAPEPTVFERLIGSWNRFQNKSYTMLRLRANGSWSSDVRVEGVTSRIVEKKGSASGTWLLDGENLVMTVADSDINEIWETNKTLFLELVDLNPDFMDLRYPNGRIVKWKRSQVKQRAAAEAAAKTVIDMKPLVVNLDKRSSNDKDRYLCLSLSLNLVNEIPEELPLLLHPEAREACLVYLSSLVYQNVQTLDLVKEEAEHLKDLLNPYMQETIREVKVNHVVISSSRDKVDEFIVEHTIGKPADTGETSDIEAPDDAEFKTTEEG